MDLILIAVILLGVCAVLTVGNLVIFALNLKLYTEILKDKSMDKRLKNKETP